MNPYYEAAFREYRNGGDGMVRAILAGLGGISVLVFGFISGESSCIFVCLILSVFYFIAAVGSFQRIKKAREEKALSEKEQIEFEKKLCEIKTQMISPVCTEEYFFWLDNHCLKWYPRIHTVKPWKIVSVEINRILFYKQFGEIITETVGSGGHSSYSIITGFHGKVNPVKISTTVHDSRTTQLFYDDGIQDAVLVLTYDDFIVLKKLIPEKDYAVVDAVRIAKATNESVSARNEALEDRIAKLERLFEKKLITEDEYQRKRNDLLDEI